MSSSSLVSNPAHMPRLDIRAVYLLSRNVDMMQLNAPACDQTQEWGISMSHYDQIIVKPIFPYSESSEEDSLFGGSPLAQAYKKIIEDGQQSSMNQLQQSILAFADISENLTHEKIEAFWNDHSQPLLFITLVSLNQKAKFSYAQECVRTIFPSNTLVYFTFDYNDMVIFHKGGSLSDYVHKVMKFDYSPFDPSRAEPLALVSDSITLYSFSNEYLGHYPTDETFDAYLRMGIANNHMMDIFQHEVENISGYEDSIHVNYILGRHDIGFYQSKATLDWVHKICEKIQEATDRLDQCQKEQQQNPDAPIWYTTSTLSIRLPPNCDLPHLGETVWDGTHPEPALRNRLKKAYEDFCIAYKEAGKCFEITVDGTWLNWLEKGYEQALSFLESDLMQDLGLCLTPLYLEFLRYATRLWEALGMSDRFTLSERNLFRREAEANFMDLFQNVSILTDSMNHSSRQFIQTPPFRTMAFSIPPKLMAYYTAVSHHILEVLQDDTDNQYGLMIAPSFIQALEVISLAQERLTGENQLLSIKISETSLYTLQLTTFYLAHELSHYVGYSNRERKVRRDLVMKACIHDFLWAALDIFLTELNRQVCHSLGYDEEEPKFHLKREDIWDNLAIIADTVRIWMYENMNDRWTEVASDHSELYLREVIVLVHETLKKLTHNSALLNQIYSAFWNQIDDHNTIYKALATKLDKNAPLNLTIQHFVYQQVKLIFENSIQEFCDMDMGLGTDAIPKVEEIADLFRETFADLQAARLLNLSPKDYLDIFRLKETAVLGDSMVVPKPHRARVLAVLSVLPGEAPTFHDGTFKRLLRALKSDDYNELMEYLPMHGIAINYVHEYLDKCLQAIDRAFDNVPKVDKLRELYHDLGNEKSVEELMQTLRMTTQEYRGTLCRHE